MPFTPHPKGTLPTIARIVLSRAGQHFTQGTISPAVFEAQIRRLVREELRPNGLTLLVRHLAGGRIRFLVKSERTGDICEMLEVCENARPKEGNPAENRFHAGIGEAASLARRNST